MPTRQFSQPLDFHRHHINGEEDDCCGSSVIETGPPGMPGMPGGPGVQGPPGIPGSPAWTYSTVDFIFPAPGDSVTVFVQNALWMVEGSFVWVEDADSGQTAFMQVAQVINPQTVVLYNPVPPINAPASFYGIAQAIDQNDITGTIYTLTLPQFPAEWTPQGDPSPIPDGAVFFVRWAEANQATDNTTLNINTGTGGPLVVTQAGGVLTPIGPVLAENQVSCLVYQSNSQSLILLV